MKAFEFSTLLFLNRLNDRFTLNVLFYGPVHLCVLVGQASEEPEERETLALMAARGESEESHDGETYIEKYTRGVLEVENILSLERLRQVGSMEHTRRKHILSIIHMMHTYTCIHIYSCCAHTHMNTHVRQHTPPTNILIHTYKVCVSR